MQPAIPGEPSASAATSPTTICTPSPKQRCLLANGVMSIGQPSQEHFVEMLGLFSPSTAEKIGKPSNEKTKPKHTTMKCGWICLDCRAVEFKMDDLRLHLCRGAHVHQNVYCASYMCQTCPAIADDFSSFKNEVCPCTLAEGAAPPDEAKRPSALPASNGSGALRIAKAARGKIGGPPLQVPCRLEDKAPPSQATAATGKPKPDESKPTSPQQPKPLLPSACFSKESKVVPSPPSEASRCLRDELEKAQQNLQRLLILKALEAEREKLEKLMAEKQKSLRAAAHCPLMKN